MKTKSILSSHMVMLPVIFIAFAGYFLSPVSYTHLAFEKLLSELGIPQPKGRAVTNIEEGVKAAEEIGYPVLVRPSFVLGGRAMQIVAKEKDLRNYLKTAVEIDEDRPVLVDKYICGKEVEIDAVCDGTDVFVPGIMELVERTGIHSGDSISVYPTFSISEKVKETILDLSLIHI